MSNRGTLLWNCSLLAAQYGCCYEVGSQIAGLSMWVSRGTIYALSIGCGLVIGIIFTSFMRSYR